MGVNFKNKLGEKINIYIYKRAENKYPDNKNANVNTSAVIVDVGLLSVFWKIKKLLN